MESNKDDKSVSVFDKQLRFQKENVLCQSLTLLHDKLLILARTLATPKTKPKTEEQKLVESAITYLIQDAGTITYLIQSPEKELVKTLEQLRVPLLRKPISMQPDYRASLVQHILRNKEELLVCANQRLEEILADTRTSELVRKESRFIQEAILQTDCPYCCTEQVDTVFCSNLHVACSNCYKQSIQILHYYEDRPIRQDCPICREKPLTQPD
jgi:hypothetical protein